MSKFATGGFPVIMSPTHSPYFEFQKKLLEEMAKTMGLTYDQLTQSQSRLHRQNATPIVFNISMWSIREPRTDDMRQMIDDIDRVSLTKGSAVRLLRSTVQSSAQRKLRLNECYGRTVA